MGLVLEYGQCKLSLLSIFPCRFINRTGRDFADEYPSAEVIGTDVSPIQPTWVPPNVKFELDDAKAIPWPYPDNHFDLVHMRLLVGSISDWVAVYKEILRVLKPGGWFEHTEYGCDFVSDDESQSAGAALSRCTWI